MRKYFHGSALFLCILALCVSGCGGGSAADPMGTGTVTLTADSTSVEPGGSCTLTATVTNGTNPVIGETVSFAVLTDNGGTVSFANDKTGAGGVARATYTAGNNLIPDTVRVITSVGATASVTITKTGTPRGKVVALTASPDPSTATINPGDLITVTATVKDSGYVVQNERVTFALTTSIGSSLSSQSGTTNALGQVTTIYTAGNGSSQDVFTATLSNGATAQMIITVTGQKFGYTAKLETDPDTVEGGDPNDVGLTVTVLDNNSQPVQWMRVRFNQPVSSDPTLDLGYISPSNAYTGVDGKVTATFYYTGAFAGAYERIEINAYVDVNDNGVYDEGEPTAQANIDVK